MANIEAVHFYELFDEPAKPAPENRFGLMYAMGSPKPHLFAAPAFAGGSLSAQERLEITNRGLLTDAEITAMQASMRLPGKRWSSSVEVAASDAAGNVGRASIGVSIR